MSLDSVNAVFVYGTLKTGQCRQTCWPRQPREIRRAWTTGELYDTGPYPAMFRGTDLVGGQVWLFDSADIPAVIAELDEVEEYRPGHESTNLYNRQVIDCFDERSESIRAYTYIYGREAERGIFRRLLPAYPWRDQRLALWPEGVDW